ncbi:armadillo-type protein [Spinellus fusiger]|nr:armadillo-type protein [Spinellus fusiger]
MNMYRHDTYKRTSLSGSSGELRRKRVLLDSKLRKKHREALFSAKRVYFFPLEEAQDTCSENDVKTVESYLLDCEHVQTLVQGLTSSDKETRLEAIQNLSVFVLEPSDALVCYLETGECIKTLMSTMVEEADPQVIYHTAQVIANITAGPYHVCLYALPAIPYLVVLLSSDVSTIREVASDALGNMACEEKENVQDSIVKSGAIPCLLRMLESNEAKLVCSSALTLTSLYKVLISHSSEVLPVLFSRTLFRKLTKEAAETSTEICWLLSHVASESQAFRLYIIENGWVDPLVSCLQALVSYGPAVLSPLRVLGHLVKDTATRSPLSFHSFFLTTLVELIHSEDWTIVKEALWVLSLMTVEPTAETVHVFKQANLIYSVANIIIECPYEICEEAAECLFHLILCDISCIPDLPHSKLLPVFLDFIQSQERALVLLGLSYVDFLLTHVKEGSVLLKSFPHTKDILVSLHPTLYKDIYDFGIQLAYRIQ